MAEKLGKDIDEILAWPLAKFELWVAYFNLKAKREERARNQQQRPKSRKRGA